MKEGNCQGGEMSKKGRGKSGQLCGHENNMLPKCLTCGSKQKAKFGYKESSIISFFFNSGISKIENFTILIPKGNSY